MKSIKKKCDALLSKIVRKKGYCELCLKRGNLNAHHIISRANHSLRYDMKNLIPLCISCHFHCHQDPTEIVEWLKDNDPKRYKYLLKEKKKIRQLKTQDYEEILKTLEQLL